MKGAQWEAEQVEFVSVLKLCVYFAKRGIASHRMAQELALGCRVQPLY